MESEVQFWPQSLPSLVRRLEPQYLVPRPWVGWATGVPDRRPISAGRERRRAQFTRLVCRINHLAAKMVSTDSRFLICSLGIEK